MVIILTKDYKKESGRIIKKGRRMIVTNEHGLKLIDKKAARPLNFIDKATDKIKEFKEKATHEPENVETADTKPEKAPKKEVKK